MPPENHTPLTPGQRALVEDNAALAVWAAARWRRRNPDLAGALGDHEDVVQTAHLGLLRAARLYDPAKARFATYAVVSCWRFLHQQAAAAGAIRCPASATAEDRRRVSVGPLPEGGLLPGPGGATVTVDAAAAAEIGDLLGRMRPRDAGILRELWSGRTAAEVGRRLGLTKERVRQIANEAERKLLALAGEVAGPVGPEGADRLKRRGRR